MTRPLICLTLVVSALSFDTANAADKPHHWVAVPHQTGIRVDLNSIEHGHFPTGPAMDGSPIADTRALVDEYGTIWPDFFWCVGSKTTFGPVQYGVVRASDPSGPFKPSHVFDKNEVQAFVCRAKSR